jgi:hypothetical protein
VSDGLRHRAVLTVEGVEHPNSDQLVKTWAGVDVTDIVVIEVRCGTQPLTQVVGVRSEYMRDQWALAVKIAALACEKQAVS